MSVSSRGKSLIYQFSIVARQSIPCGLDVFDNTDNIIVVASVTERYNSIDIFQTLVTQLVAVGSEVIQDILLVLTKRLQKFKG